MSVRRQTREGWNWFDAEAPSAQERRQLNEAFSACFGTSHGERVLEHLCRLFLDRRVAPSASDAELRHVEGQRSAIAYIVRMLEGTTHGNDRSPS